MKKLPWFEIILVVVFLTIQFYAAFSDAHNFPNTWFNRDDAYYYFKVAQNISQGAGSTFDGIHPTNGYHPLWLLICIPIFALARFDLILPLRVLLVVMSLINLATAILLYRLIGGAMSRPAGMLAAIYWVFNPTLQGLFYQPGLESGIALFFVVLALYIIYKIEQNWRKEGVSLRKIAFLGLVSTLAVFSRLDLVFFASIIGVWIVFRGTPLRYFLLLDILAILISTLLAFILRLGIAEYYQVSNSAFIITGVTLAIQIPTFYFFDLYQRPAALQPIKTLRNILRTVAVSGAIIFAILWTGSVLHVLPAFSLTIFALNTLFTLAFVILIRAAAYGFRGTNLNTQTIRSIDLLREYWKSWLREGAVYYGIVGGTLAVYMLWNKLTFGTFSPVSGQIKRWWGTFESNVYGGAARNFISFFMLNPASEFNAWSPFTDLWNRWTNKIFYIHPEEIPFATWQKNFLISLVILLVVLYGMFLLKKNQTKRTMIQTGLIPLGIASWIQILSYNSTGYASLKEWYWLTEQVLFVVVMALLANLLFGLIHKQLPIGDKLIWALVGIIGIVAIWGYWKDASNKMPYRQAAANAPYIEALPFLEEHTQPGDIIGMTGGGNIGYFIHDRTIVNMDGLINSYDYFLASKNGTGSDYLYDTGMRYVFANPYIMDQPPYRRQYMNRLELVVEWGGKDLLRLLPTPNP